MSRQVYIYKIDFNKLKQIFIDNIDNEPISYKVSLKTWIEGYENERKISFIKLTSKIKENPELIKPRELEIIIDWLNHYFHDKDYSKTIDFLQNIGITQIFEIPTTSLGTTFLDIFDNFFIHENNINFQDSVKLLDINEFDNLLKWIICLCDYFNADDKLKLDKHDLSLISKVEKLYSEQVELRTIKGELYEGKWNIDYFNFATWRDNFKKLFETLQLINGDKILIIDCF